jgi:hypothetical protein
VPWWVYLVSLFAASRRAELAGAGTSGCVPEWRGGGVGAGQRGPRTHHLGRSSTALLGIKRQMQSRLTNEPKKELPKK